MSKAAMKKMGKKVESMLPKEFGYAIIVFKFNQPGVSNYISNAERTTMIQSLRETANRLESNQDFETPENNMY